MPEPISDMNRNKEVGGGFYSSSCGVSNNNSITSSNSNFFNCGEEPLDINVRNLENLSLMDNLGSLSGIENNENLAYFQDFDSVLNSYIDDPKEGNISRTVRVPSSEHVAEIVGRQGCKIKDLRARTNTYIKTPMRTQSPVFVVTGKEEAVLHVMEEIQNAAEHFTHIRASRNQHKSAGGLGGGGGLEANKPASREGDIMIQVTVPYRVVGLVVGLKGQTIKAIQQDTDTFIVTPNRDKAPIFEIRGQPENVERAKQMILRHIETRTRHCRLQDSTNLPTSWSNGGIDETTRGGSSGGLSEFGMFQSHLSSSSSSSNNDGTGSSSLNDHHSTVPFSNGSFSSGNINTNQNINQSHAFGSSGNNGNRHFGSNFSTSTSPTTHSSYGTWGGYTNMFDQGNCHHHLQHQSHAQNANTPMTTWSSATSDFDIMGNGDHSSFAGASTQHSITSSLRSSIHGNYSGLNMALGGMSSSSNSSASISPPQDLHREGSYQPASHHGMSMGQFSSSMGSSPPLRGLLQDSPKESSEFSTFPLLTSGSSSPGNSKGSLVLGNLFRSSNGGASSSLAMPMMNASSSSNNSGSTSNSTVSPISADCFHRGEDHLGSLAAVGFGAGGPGTAAASSCSSASSSSSSTSFSLPSEVSLFAGASGSGISYMLQESTNGVDNGSGSPGHSQNGESSPTSKMVTTSAAEGPVSQGSPVPRMCRMCEEAEVVAALVPCGHNLFCMECARGITNRPVDDDRKCPVCKEKATGVLLIRA